MTRHTADCAVFLGDAPAAGSGGSDDGDEPPAEMVFDDDPRPVVDESEAGIGGRLFGYTPRDDDVTVQVPFPW